MGHDDFPTPGVDVDAIDATELKARVDAGEDVAILDVRVPDEYDQWRIDGPTVNTTNVPYFEFFDEINRDLVDTSKNYDPLIVVCAKGGASEYVAGRLVEELGLPVRNLADGMYGWAAIYKRHEIERYDGPGTVYQYHRPSSGCLGYLVVSHGEAAVIDPLRAFTDQYLDDADDLGVELTYAIDTHVHADHISGVRELVAAGTSGVIPRPAAERGVTYTEDLTLVADGDVFGVGETTIEAIHTPGHTTGMTSYLIGDALLATGDGLLVESVARPDLETGDKGAPDAARQLHESLHTRLLALPDATLVGGAHVSNAAAPAAAGTYTATIGQLVDEMAALSLDEASFVDLVLSDMPPRPANYQAIIATNLGECSLDDDEAFELELGPNNCAASQDSLVAL